MLKKIFTLVLVLAYIVTFSTGCPAKKGGNASGSGTATEAGDGHVHGPDCDHDHDSDLEDDLGDADPGTTGDEL